MAASDAAGNQLLIEGGGSDVPARLRTMLGGAFLRATRQDQMVGVRLLQSDVDGYREMAAFFLGVGAFIAASLLARLVDAQRALIGTLAALGISTRRILFHFVSYAAVLTGVGGVLGAGLGSSPRGP